MTTAGVFVGLSTVDIVYGIRDFPKPNSKNVATRQDVFAGGPATNAAITFARLGGDGTLITVVGTHPLAAIIKHELAEFGVVLVDLLPETDAIPSLSSSLVTEGSGERMVVSANATRLPTPPGFSEPSRIDGASVVLVDGHHMATCRSAAEYARSQGIRVVLDGGSWKDGMAELLASVDVAICSQNFTPPGCADESGVIDYLRRQGIAEVAITNGGKAIRYASPIGSGEIPVPQVKAVDTLGAGDIFHGAFCHRYVENGFGFRGALEFASGIASRSCQYFGTRAWMTPTRI
jgi:sugar/nucleoside kinase (ribokinase family)